MINLAFILLIIGSMFTSVPFIMNKIDKLRGITHEAYSIKTSFAILSLWIGFLLYLISGVIFIRYV
jgi:hypothetical protein